jgi:DNA-binding transcriptional regulator LsrR (DeoR family)
MAPSRKKRQKRVPSSSGGSDFDRQEQITKAARMFCTGWSVSEIARELKVGRQVPYRWLQEEARRHRIDYKAPLQFEQAVKLEEACPWARVRVAHSGLASDVAYHTAELLARLIHRRRQENPKGEIHIGFAGGGLLSETARLLAGFLRERIDDFRELTLVFHAMVAGFNARNPLEDPNAFFSYFDGDPILPVSFVNLLAPGFVTAAEARTLREIGPIKEAYERAKELDIVVTSAGAHWTDEHSRLSQLYKENKAAPALAQLREAGTMGDVLWRPISENGPVEIETSARAMTLIDLSDLPPLIRAGKDVVMALGPCGTCGRPKAEILRAVLGWKEHYITHAVVDSRTAAEALAPDQRASHG